MKLSKAQKEVIQKMRDGIDLYYTPFRRKYFYHGANYSEWLRSDVAKRLEKNKIITRGKYDTRMKLTHLGKTINLNP